MENQVSLFSGEVAVYAADHRNPITNNWCNSTYKTFEHIPGTEYGRQIGSHRLENEEVCMIYSVDIAHVVKCSCSYILNPYKVVNCMIQHTECGLISYNHSGL